MPEVFRAAIPFQLAKTATIIVTGAGRDLTAAKWGSAIMILIYGDDSSDEKRQRVCAVAAIAGGDEFWQPLEAQWRARTGGIPFHARDCESDQGDYAPKNGENADDVHTRNKSLYRDLTTMLASSGVAGRAVAIDLKAQRDVFPESPDISYYKAFVALMEAAKQLCVLCGRKAKFKFDISSRNEYNAKIIYQGTRNDSPEMLDLFDSEIAFGPAKECPRLQAADLLAYEAMKILDNKVGPKQRPHRHSWKALAASGRFQADLFTQPWFEDIKRDMPKLEKMTGMNREMYLGWLRDRNRQHCDSNLIRFTTWIAEQDRRRGQQG